MTILLMQMHRQDVACTPLEQTRSGQLWTLMTVLLGPPVQDQPVQGQELLVYLSRAIGGKLCPWMRDERLGGRKRSLANRVCKNGNCSASPKRNTQHIEHCGKH